MPENIKVEDVVNNVEVCFLDRSIKEAKLSYSTNPTNLNSDLTPGIVSLAKSPKGEGHDSWLKGIVVRFDLTLTVKAWTEAERYHFFDIVMSQSTMHRVTKFDLNNQYIEYTDSCIVDRIKEMVAEYNNLLACKNSLNTRDIPKERVDEMDKILRNKYLRILYSNPCGMKLTAGMVTNYQQLKTIYSQRKNHLLPEWQTFCRWVESLPMANELIIGGNNEENNR